jgi:16S rRNA (cytosine1402-N4)-methyltransferase
LNVLNEYPEDDLYRIFREYGELKSLGRIVRAIIIARETETIKSSTQLENVLGDVVPTHTRSKFLAKIYQAIRIEVNDEVDALKEMLVQTAGCMNPGGRLVVITYHSLEDRLVKNYIKAGNLEGEIKKDFYGQPESCWKMINRKVITPAEAELEEYRRSRCAKLRIAEKV